MQNIPVFNDIKYALYENYRVSQKPATFVFEIQISYNKVIWLC